MSSPNLILWRVMHQPGHEAARLADVGDEWHLRGTSLLLQEGEPCRLEYAIVCDAEWRTRTVRVSGWIGAREIAVEITAEEGRWRMNGAEVPEVEGAIDIDLNFSPSTNLLPIRRLALGVGESGAVRAAWLRFPAFTLEPLDQTYSRLEERVYRYSSRDGAFTRDLDVDDAGFPVRYPGIWQAEPVDPG